MEQLLYTHTHKELKTNRRMDMVVKAATEQGSCFSAGDAFGPNCWRGFASVKVVRATRGTYQTELDKKSSIKQFGHRNLILCNSPCCHWFSQSSCFALLRGASVGGALLTHGSGLAELCWEVAFDWPEIPSARAQNSADVLRSPRAVGVPWNRGSLWLRPSINLWLQGYAWHNANGIPLYLRYIYMAAIRSPNTWPACVMKGRQGSCPPLCNPSRQRKE